MKNAQEIISELYKDMLNNPALTPDKGKTMHETALDLAYKRYRQTENNNQALSMMPLVTPTEKNDDDVDDHKKTNSPRNKYIHDIINSINKADIQTIAIDVVDLIKNGIEGEIKLEPEPIPSNEMKEPTDTVDVKPIKDISEGGTLLTKADAASARSRGLIPQTGNWDAPGRWIKRKKSEIPPEKSIWDMTSEEIKTYMDEYRKNVADEEAAKKKKAPKNVDSKSVKEKLVEQMPIESKKPSKTFGYKDEIGHDSRTQADLAIGQMRMENRQEHKNPHEVYRVRHNKETDKYHVWRYPSGTILTNRW